jgi:hypothetical protein
MYGPPAHLPAITPYRENHAIEKPMATSTVFLRCEKYFTLQPIEMKRKWDMVAIRPLLTVLEPCYRASYFGDTFKRVFLVP